MRDRIATEECGCEQACREREIDQRKYRAQASILQLFGQPKRDSVACILAQAIDGVARGEIKRVQIAMDDMSKVSMRLTKGEVEIIKSKTEVEVGDGDLNRLEDAYAMDADSDE